MLTHTRHTKQGEHQGEAATTHKEKNLSSRQQAAAVWQSVNLEGNDEDNRAAKRDQKVAAGTASCGSLVGGCRCVPGLDSGEPAAEGSPAPSSSD